MTPMATEPLPDPPALRLERRARLSAAMERQGLDVLIAGRVANIRYISGVPILWNAGTRPFGPGCVFVRATGEVFLMSTWDEGVPDDIPHDHLYGITWNPMNLVEKLKEVAASANPVTVGTDAMSPIFAQLLPMAFPDTEIVDAGPALTEARRIKTSDEVDAIQTAVEIAEVSLAAAVAALRPGVTEHHLAGVFMDAMASHGVTTPSRQDVARISSDRDHPDGQVQADDLVAFSAGVIANGYAGEVGRTWPVAPSGDGHDVRDLYQRWERLWEMLLAACQPGAAGSDLLEAYSAAGEPPPGTPIARGLGLGFDDPVISHDLPETAARERMDPGLVLLVTATVSEPGTGTITAHEVIHITANGPDVLSRSPFWNRD